MSVRHMKTRTKSHLHTYKQLFTSPQQDDQSFHSQTYLVSGAPRQVADEQLGVLRDPGLILVRRLHHLHSTKWGRRSR